MYENIDRADLTQFGFDASSFKKVRGGREWQGHCPWCNDPHQKDRMRVSNGKYLCRKCGRGGTLVSLLKEKPSEEEIRKANEISKARRLKEEEQERKEKEAKLLVFNKEMPWMQFHLNLLDNYEVLQLLEKDGISKRAVNHFMLGFIESFNFSIDGQKFTAPGITFPINAGNKMHNIRIRLLDKRSYSKSPIDDITGDKYRPYLYRVGASFFNASINTSNFVVIVEGEKKAIVLWENDIPAIGIQGAYTFKEEWIPWFKDHFSNIFLALDPDEGGQAGANRIKEMLGARNIVLDGKPDDLLVSGMLTKSQFARLLSVSLYGRS